MRLHERWSAAEALWLCTISQDGAPHAVPLWFLADGDRLLMWSEETSVHVRNLRRNRRAFAHLEGTKAGQVVRAAGITQLTHGYPPEKFLLKYDQQIRDGGWAERLAVFSTQIIFYPTGGQSW